MLETLLRLFHTERLESYFLIIYFMATANRQY